METKTNSNFDLEIVAKMQQNLLSRQDPLFSLWFTLHLPPKKQRELGVRPKLCEQILKKNIQQWSENDQLKITELEAYVNQQISDTDGVIRFALSLPASTLHDLGFSRRSWEIIKARRSGLRAYIPRY